MAFIMLFASSTAACPEQETAQETEAEINKKLL